MLEPKIKGIALYGGEGKHEAKWKRNGSFWDTRHGSGWVLGVGREKGVHLLNLKDTSVEFKPSGAYYLYAEPAPLGSNPKLEIDLSNGTKISAVFQMDGEPGSGAEWTRTDGNERLSLGWGNGEADRVGSNESINPSKKNGVYLYLKIDPPENLPFLLGLLSVLQIVFLPGFLVTRMLKVNDGLIKTWILSFTLSLIINHFLVMILVLFKIYCGTTVYIIFGVEVGLVGWLVRNDVGKPIRVVLGGDGQRIKDLVTEITRVELFWQAVKWFLVFLATATLVFFVLKLWEGVGTIFYRADPVCSWNMWAVRWYQNSFPVGTMHYPQLLPTNWSLTYVFIGSTLQFFAKGIMALFPLSILFISLDLALRSGKIGYIIGISATGALLCVVLGVVIQSGHADVPVAFLTLAAIYMLLISQFTASAREVRKNLLLGAVFCAGSALTKQAGLYIVLVYPLLSYILVLRPRKGLIAKKKAGQVLVVIVILVGLVAPWYVNKELQIRKGLDWSEITDLTSKIHKGRSFGERLVRSLKWAEPKIGGLMLYIILPMSLFLSALDRSWRWILVLVTLPFFFLWALFWGYDIRNIAVSIPLIGMGAGIGLENAVIDRKGFLKLWEKLVPVRISLVLTIVIGVCLVLGSRFDEGMLIDKQLLERKRIGDQHLNNILYKYHNKFRIEKKIISNYPQLAFLPEIGRFHVMDHFSDLGSLIRKIKETGSGYLLVHSYLPMDPDVDAYIKRKLANGDYEMISNLYGNIFLKIQG